MALHIKNPPEITAKMEAYAFQASAVDAVKDLEFAAIFHEQGLGKTKIGIDLILHWLKNDSCDVIFIVTKKSLVSNWLEEVERHSHLRPAVLSSNKSENAQAFSAAVMVYVLNYEVVPANLELISLFLKTCRVAAILDESHKIKNPEAKVTKSFHEIACLFHKRIIMSGTPVANRPYDIWSQVYFLDRGLSLGPSFSEFREKTDFRAAPTVEHGAAIEARENNDSEYSTILSNIFENISEFAIRETKASSGLNLPKKSYKNHEVELSGRQKALYDKYKFDLRSEILVGNAVIVDEAESILKRLLRLVQIASNPNLVDEAFDEAPSKLSILKQLVDSIIDSGSEVIIWSSFIKNIEWLSLQFQEYNPAYVHGSLSVEFRDYQIEKFKKDRNCKILFATPGAAKEGLTLTNANHAIFYDRGFSLDDYLQAQDRIHRISQKQDCFIHNIIAVNTIDDWVDGLLHVKSIAAQLTQGDINQKDFLNNFTIDLNELLESVLN